MGNTFKRFEFIQFADDHDGLREVMKMLEEEYSKIDVPDQND